MIDWTPTKIRQPETNGRYFATVSTGKSAYSETLNYMDGFWNCTRDGYGNIDRQFDMTENVTAWMKLPEPYKESGEE